MREYTCPEAQFLADVADHQMTTIRNDGVHRHIRFKRPDSWAYWFDLITWPGTLCIDGDMGTYVFRRLEDMFEFFRTDLARHGTQLAINPGYWSEKLQAPAPQDAEKFSADAFRQRVKEAFDAWAAEYESSDEPGSKAQLWSDLEDDVLSIADDGEIRAIDAARDFSSAAAEDFGMDDCWEWRCREYTFHFIWCCYAIAWGVKTYDVAKEPNK